MGTQKAAGRLAKAGRPAKTRIKKSNAPNDDDRLFDLIKATPGNLSHDFIDIAFWQNLPETSADWFWLTALDQLDRLGNKEPLLHLLSSNCELSPKVRTYLADLIVRGVRPSKKHPHRPA
jgi:hypothetical protein